MEDISDLRDLQDLWRKRRPRPRGTGTRAFLERSGRICGASAAQGRAAPAQEHARNEAAGSPAYPPPRPVRASSAARASVRARVKQHQSMSGGSSAARPRSCARGPCSKRSCNRRQGLCARQAPIGQARANREEHIGRLKCRPIAKLRRRAVFGTTLPDLRRNRRQGFCARQATRAWARFGKGGGANLALLQARETIRGAAATILVTYM